MNQTKRFPQVDDRLFLQSVARALDVMEAFAASPNPKSLGEIAEAAGINRSAAQRIGQTLLARGYLEQTGTGRLTLGRQFLDRSFDYLRSNDLIERAMPVLMDLRRETEERVDLSLFDAVHDDLTTVYAARFQSKRETFYATLAGRRLPTFISSGGRACLALLPDERVDDILARSTLTKLTPRSIATADGVKAEVAKARALGYAWTVDEVLLGEVAVAAAIRGPGGAPVGAIHIAGSLAEWSPEAFRARFAPLAMSAAAALSSD